MCGALADYTPLWAGDATIKRTSIVVNCPVI